MTIPPCVHFCWIGPRLPWAYAFAVLSAAERSEMRAVILHHTDPLEDSPPLRALQEAASVTLARIDPLDCLNQAAGLLGLGDSLAALYQRLVSPVMRSDVLRAAILYLQGGVYLDLDTITTASLLPLLDTEQFVVSEYIVWPHAVRISRSPVVLARAVTLDVLRKGLRILPQGWRGFRRIEKFCFQGVNNAIMGAAIHAPLMAEYLRAMARLPPERQNQSYALGPDLLQEIADRFAPAGLKIYEPRVFFPLGPEISEHWFRPSGGTPVREVLFAQTRVVHWYASVRGKSRVAQISPDYIAAHQGDQLYAALVHANIHPLPVA